ncbi:PA14 domain-containing protein [Dactylosporangium sp. McL0621]|uniref:PA14 domain-containing protein n=1 Tax=Dactylosporangium sp. McL0621 TaxID=3415678 RepID=UPI003CF2BFF0
MRRSLPFTLLLAFVAALLGPVPAARAATPPGFATQLLAGSGLDGPTGFEIAPDGRIFILERTGKVKIFKDGRLLESPFADLPSEASGDRGLIGVAFDPAFGGANHWVYFYYTGHDLRNHLVRFDASGDVGTEGPYTIFETQSPSQLLHVGGSIRFGPDGKLYFAVGDNGYPPNAQDLSNPHGKILRINPDGTVPADNPFYGQPGKLAAIWAYGFRNPWRFQFDDATGRLYAGDVGDYTWEELNLVVKGGNYGWPVHEGRCTSNCAGYTDPVTAYNHDGGSGAVTAGPVYHGGQFPAEYAGSLFFGDYSRGFIKRAVLDPAGQVTGVQDFDLDAGSVVDLKVAPDGSLYYITYFPGQLYRVSYSPAGNAPAVHASADTTGGPAPLTVHYSSAGTSDPDGDDLTYTWNFGDGSISTAPNPTKVYPDIGVYPATLTVSDGSSTVASRPIVIQVGTPPVVRIAAPVDGSAYNSGDTITFNAFGNDAAGFDVSDGDIKTEVFLHHNTHVHPFAGPLTGRVGQFTIPTTGEASADTWFEVKVTVTDRNGLSSTKSVSIHPRTSTMTFATSPPGLGLTLDGVPIATPDAVPGVVGFRREIAAPPTATDAAGNVYHFTGWSDGGAIRHFVTTPAADATWTATYAPSAAFTGEYFNNQNLDGAPALVRADKAVDFVWSTDPPGPGVAADHFSARWTKTEYFAAGRYRFTVASDDGARLYLDGDLVIDQWHDQGPTAYDHVADLGAGEHTVRMEFYDNVVDASARLSWDTTPDQPRDVFTAQYWSTPGAGDQPSVPATAPTLTRDETAVDHDWQLGSPDPAIPADHFVARWTRSLTLAAGYYDFTTTTDDGVRLWVDGQLAVDHWGDQGPTPYTAHLPLGNGAHTVVMEYYENGGGALARLAWARTGDIPAPPPYLAKYTGAGGDLYASESTVDHEWGDGGPGGGIGADDFRAEYTRTVVLPAGLYRFAGASDDGVRVSVDGLPIVDKWRDQNEDFSADISLLGGAHDIRVEYYEHAAGARLHFGYKRVGDVAAPAGWSGAYYAGRDMSGAPAMLRTDGAIDFDWGAGSPGPAIPADGFSARWTRTDHLAGGTYRITATSDDGIRVLLDGDVVIDGWSEHPPATFTYDTTLLEGDHTITVEYFESGGGALARCSVIRL